jgi:hypothetical protein
MECKMEGRERRERREEISVSVLTVLEFWCFLLEIS